MNDQREFQKLIKLFNDDVAKIIADIGAYFYAFGAIDDENFHGLLAIIETYQLLLERGHLMAKSKKTTKTTTTKKKTKKSKKK